MINGLLQKPMTKQQVSVYIDTHLLAAVDRLTPDRDVAIEDALAAWCDRQMKARAHNSFEAQRRRQDQDETGWLV